MAHDPQNKTPVTAGVLKYRYRDSNPVVVCTVREVGGTL